MDNKHMNMTMMIDTQFYQVMFLQNAFNVMN